MAVVGCVVWELERIVVNLCHHVCTETHTQVLSVTNCIFKIAFSGQMSWLGVNLSISREYSLVRVIVSF